MVGCFRGLGLSLSLAVAEFSIGERTNELFN